MSAIGTFSLAQGLGGAAWATLRKAVAQNQARKSEDLLLKLETDLANDQIKQMDKATPKVSVVKAPTPERVRVLVPVRGLQVAKSDRRQRLVMSRQGLPILGGIHNGRED